MKILRSTLALVSLSAAYGIKPTPILIEVLAGETRCIADTVRRREDTTFQFKAAQVEGDTYIGEVEVRVDNDNPDGGESTVATLTEQWQFHYVDHTKGEGGFTYRVCFDNLKPSGSTRVELMETTLSLTQGASEVAKHLQPVDELLKYAVEVAESLKAQLEEGALSEKEGIDSDMILRSRINKLAGFTIMVLLSVSGWQLVLLNRFFRSKKLI